VFNVAYRPGLYPVDPPASARMPRAVPPGVITAALTGRASAGGRAYAPACPIAPPGVMSVTGEVCQLDEKQIPKHS
jgi:hypothetical protein